jgi:hypothetical protein
MAWEAGKTEPQERIDGLWLAKVRGIPLMHRDYSNVTFRTRAAAEAAIRDVLSEPCK